MSDEESSDENESEENSFESDACVEEFDNQNQQDSEEDQVSGVVKNWWDSD